jgi:hypothetical protein
LQQTQKVEKSEVSTITVAKHRSQHAPKAAMDLIPKL